VFALVLRQAAVPIGAGLAAGCAGALVMGQLAAGLLFQVRPRDPVVLVAVTGIVAAAGMLAAAAAARRNLHIDPVEALKQD
jgi:ABC-type antimicrobial peptide transport system permease subunit